MDESDALFDELLFDVNNAIETMQSADDGVEDYDVDDMLSSQNLSIVSSGDIEAFCVWEGTIVCLAFPTQASGWNRLDDNDGNPTSHNRWEYYDHSLMIVAKHRSCLKAPIPIQTCNNCAKRNVWRKVCETPVEVFYLFLLVDNPENAVDLPLLINRRIQISEEATTRFLEIMPSPVTKSKPKKVDTKPLKLGAMPAVSASASKTTDTTTTILPADPNDPTIIKITKMYKAMLDSLASATGAAQFEKWCQRIMSEHLNAPFAIEDDIFKTWHKLSNIRCHTYIYVNHAIIPWLLRLQSNVSYCFMNSRGLLDDLLNCDMLTLGFTSSIHVISDNITTVCKSGEYGIIMILDRPFSGCATVPPYQLNAVPVGIVKMM